VRLILAVVLAVVMSLAPAFALEASPDPAGVVKNTFGKVIIVREGKRIEATPRTLLFEGDLIQTGYNGRAGVVLQDDTIISLGRKSTFVLTKYRYQPNEKDYSLIFRLLRGTALYISGQIAKLAPGSVRIETPNAIIGVRGSQILIEVG